LAVLSGCLSEETANEMASRESVLAPLFNNTTEFDAVVWANDEYDADKRARGTAMLAFSPVGGKPDYVRILYVRYLTDKDANVRAVAVTALGRHGSPDHVPLIVPLLKDPSRSVRFAAACTLQRLHNPVAVTPLLDSLDPRTEPDGAIRAEVADALGQYAEPRVLDGLAAALDDSDIVVNQRALASLKTLTGQSLPADRRAWTRWLHTTTTPFAGRTTYFYPAYSRSRTLLEHIPFIPQPPNEVPGQPIGMPAVRQEPPVTG
jgi:HEAT repeat protein